ncbi:MAG: ABC transporter permease [Alphaproteobacteria bacterium]|nr:ABC transporter permease [Alphaproteobacteria bacterium]MBV8548337.1 ABC transporter permease [Alphaproteobacteria bacterium]
MISGKFSLQRMRALIIKEFIQILRDRSTFGIIFMMPIIQLMIYGYAINTNPKHLPTAVVMADDSLYVRSLTAAMQNTGYFSFTDFPPTVAEAEDLMAKGDVQFIIEIPQNFSRDLLRGEHPDVLVVADATDPVAIGNAISSVAHINTTALSRDLEKAGDALQTRGPPFTIKVHNRYNPEGLTAYNIVPGLIGLLLNMTLISMTAVAITRERERGTLENLLAMPARPFEVMIGKITPFIIIAYMQAAVILIVSHILFGLPIEGSLLLLIFGLSIYIAANLAIGFTISTFATNQLQAMQMTFFYFLPSLLLSGFLFPFRGMPLWAQYLGNAFPITHALRILRGLVLKGIGLHHIAADLWAMAAALVVVGYIAMKRYRETID